MVLLTLLLARLTTVARATMQGGAWAGLLQVEGVI
jgi:hypothetical protein